MALGLFLVSVLSALFFAVGILLSQFGLRHLPGLIGASISVPTSAVFFLCLSPFTVEWSSWHGPSAVIFALSGLVYPAAVTLLNFTSNRRLGATLTAAMGNLTPLFAITLAIVVLGEMPHRGQLIGIATIFAGLLLIASARLRSHPAASLWLLLIPMAGAALRGAAQPLVKIGLADWPDAFAAATLAYAVSAGVIWLVRGAVRPGNVSVTLAGVLWFVAIGLANGMALVTLYLALNEGQVTAVAPIVATYPLMTYAINRLILRQSPVSWQGVLGIVLSVCGVILLLVL